MSIHNSEGSPSMSNPPSQPSAVPNALSLAPVVLRRGWTNNYHDAEDLCQEGMLRMLAATARGVEILNPSTYLRRAIWSAAVDDSRRQKVAAVPINDLDPVDPEHSIRDREIEETVRVCMRQMPFEAQALLRRHGMNGESFESIGREQGSSAATVFRRWKDVKSRFVIKFDATPAHEL
jgi:RNA polymerase sigma factor (sigma-70 family)